MPQVEPKGRLSLLKITWQIDPAQTSPSTKCVDLTMAGTVVLMTSVPTKDVIKKFLETVCGFTADAAKEITKNQGYNDLGNSYLLNNKELTPSALL
jgi:hypothetical protein